MNVNKISKLEAAYIAGLFDGEGSLFKQPSGRLVFTVTQGDYGKNVLNYLKDVFGVGTVGIHRKAIGNWQAVWRYRIQSTELATQVILSIYPYLKIKNRRVDEVLK